MVRSHARASLRRVGVCSQPCASSVVLVAMCYVIRAGQGSGSWPRTSGAKADRFRLYPWTRVDIKFFPYNNDVSSLYHNLGSQLDHYKIGSDSISWEKRMLSPNHNQATPENDIAVLVFHFRDYVKARTAFFAHLDRARSCRDPLSIFSETLVAQLLGGTLAESRVQPSYDLITSGQRLVQVKYLANPDQK